MSMIKFAKLLSVLLILIFASCWVYILTKKSRIVLSAHSQYAVKINRTNVTVKIGFNLDVNYSVIATEYLLDDQGNYNIKAFRSSKTYRLNSNMNDRQIATVIINDVAKGHHNIYYNGLLLCEFDWPSTDTKYLHSPHPYNDIKMDFEQVGKILEDELFYQQWWVAGKWPDPE